MVDLMKPFLFVDDVMELLKLKEDASYKIIRKMNDELETKGFIVIKGRVPAKYFCKRTGIDREVTK